MVEEFSIRSATPADIDAILGMVRELAEYENLLDQYVATEKQFQEALFGEKPMAGELEDEPVAFALFFHNFSTFVGKPGLYLEDLLNHPTKVGVSARPSSAI